jgi:TatA/E family protein of Tat protein translocase
MSKVASALRAGGRIVAGSASNALRLRRSGGSAAGKSAVYLPVGFGAFPARLAWRAMGSFGFTEMIVVLVIALLVFGPTKLPELARNLGKGLAEFRRASNDLRRSIMEADAPPKPPRPPQGPADEVVAAPLPSPAGAAPIGISAPASKGAATQAPPAPAADPANSKPGEPIP